MMVEDPRLIVEEVVAAVDIGADGGSRGLGMHTETDERTSHGGEIPLQGHSHEEREIHERLFVGSEAAGES